MPALLAAMIVAWLADWLVRQVPGLDPAQSREVAQVLVDHGYKIIVAVGLVCWRYFRRPGDIAADSPAAVFHRPSDPGLPPSPGERK